jgi:hypothetical protein
LWSITPFGSAYLVLSWTPTYNKFSAVLTSTAGYRCWDGGTQVPCISETDVTDFVTCVDGVLSGSFTLTGGVGGGGPPCDATGFEAYVSF